jgi:hypothetical protein
MIIELWFVFCQIHQRGPHVGGYIVSLMKDKTSALSWQCYAAQLH